MGTLLDGTGKKSPCFPETPENNPDHEVGQHRHKSSLFRVMAAGGHRPPAGLQTAFPGRSKTGGIAGILSLVL